MNEISSVDESCDTPLLLKNLKLKNTSRRILGHLNINSIVGKFDHLKVLIENNIDILVLTETKIDSSFPNDQFRTDSFSAPFRLDQNRFGGGFLIYVREDIPFISNFTYHNKQLTKHILPDDVEGVFVEINFNIDFNIEETDLIMPEFLFKNDSKNLVQQKLNLKAPIILVVLIFFVTNSPRSFPNTITFASGLSDFHKMILTILKSTFPKVRPKQRVYRKFKSFDLNNFKNDIRTRMQFINMKHLRKNFLKY